MTVGIISYCLSISKLQMSTLATPAPPPPGLIVVGSLISVERWRPRGQLKFRRRLKFSCYLKSICAGSATVKEEKDVSEKPKARLILGLRCFKVNLKNISKQYIFQNTPNRKN